MKIDRNNYEMFFIDYLDGTLPVEKIDEILDFLAGNKDLAEELKGLEKISLADSSEKKYLGIELHKTDLDMSDLFEEDCIRCIEGELTKNDESLFLQRIKDDEQSMAVFNLYRSTISEPDPFIVYEKKDKLKKKERKIYIPLWYTTAAIIILGIFFFIPRDNSKDIGKSVIVLNNTFPDEPIKVKIDDISLKTGFSIIKEGMTGLAEVVASIKSKDTGVIVAPVEETVIAIAEHMVPMTTMQASAFIKSTVDNMHQLMSVDLQEPLTDNDYSKYLTLGEFITLKFNEFTSRENFEKLKKSTFKSIKDASDEKFNYTISVSGEVKSIEYQSRLLAFSIPLGKN